MKTKAVAAVGFTLLVFVCMASGQGQVLFANSSTTRITNCYTRLPQSNTVFVGLYATPDLTAVTNQSAVAGMTLIFSTKTSGAQPFLHGRFDGGLVTFPGMANGQSVALQVRAWTTNFPTYEVAAANGGEVAVSLIWIQTVAVPPSVPGIISHWGFRPFLFPQCEPLRVPLFIERPNNSTVRVNWPLGLPPILQVNDGSSTNWQTLTSGTFVQDHWEFEVTPANGVQLFRLAQ
jgi:hypothetical protein